MNKPTAWPERDLHIDAPAIQTDEHILHRIAQLQAIQKTHKYTSPAWQTASELLQPLFAEMNARAIARKG